MINAKDLPLGQGMAGLPNVNSAITGWFQPLTFKTVCKAQIDGYTQEIESTVSTRGVRQPLKPYELQMKQEGQRTWNWEKLHCSPDVILKTDDIVVFDKAPYRVMAIYNYAQYGYMEYEIASAFKDC